MVGAVDSGGQGYIVWKDNYFFLLVKYVVLLTERVWLIVILGPWNVFFNQSIDNFYFLKGTSAVGASWR